MQRSEGTVVHTLAELRALAARARAVKDGMEATRKNLLGDAPSTPTVTQPRRGPSSWLAARTSPRAK